MTGSDHIRTISRIKNVAKINVPNSAQHLQYSPRVQYSAVSTYNVTWQNKAMVQLFVYTPLITGLATRQNLPSLRNGSRHGAIAKDRNVSSTPPPWLALRARARARARGGVRVGLGLKRSC